VRNEVRNETRNAASTEQNNIAISCKKNPKIFWKFINSKVKNRHNIGDLKVVNKATLSEEIVVTEDRKVEAFSDFFSTVFVEENTTVPVDLEVIPNTPVMQKLVIDENIILKKLDNLNTHKSSGPDELHPRVLYEVRNEIAFPLKLIFEKSLITNQLPLDWRSANISPIFKKGSKNDVKNYRPISLTCICCKIFESIIRDHLYEYFITNNLLSNKQYGFIKGRSTVLQLLKVLDDWSEMLEFGGQIDVLYTDLEKAFDRVPHARLVSKLRSYNLCPVILGWIKAFLNNRRQRVVLGDVFSNWVNVLSGVPQGSVLGPLLFLIYINDLPYVCNSGSCVFLYADDAKLYKHILNDQDRFILQEDINNLTEWANKWLIKLNINKCKVVSYGRTINHNFSYHIDNIQVEEVLSIKDLGVTFDPKLSFESHINEKINKAYSFLGLIKRNFPYLNKDAFLQVYKAMVRSHLEYAGSIWFPYKVSYIEKIETVQMRATKLFYPVRNLNYVDRLRNLDLPTLYYRRLRGDMILVYKMFNGLSDNVFNFIRSHTVTRGNSFKLFPEHMHYDCRKYSFRNRVISIWNSLPDHVVCARSLFIFERNLDKFWFNQECKYDWQARLTGIGNRSEHI